MFQRRTFGSALDSNLDFHALVLDGAYSCASPFSRPAFHRAEPLTDQDVIEVTTRLHRRILRHLVRCGRLPQAEQDEEEVQPDEPLLSELYAASVQGRVAIGERSGASVERLGRRRDARRSSCRANCAATSTASRSTPRSRSRLTTALGSSACADTSPVLRS